MVIKEIIYPVFLNCIKFNDNIFWKNIFEDLSYGVTPIGTYINKKDFLCCNYKNKEFIYKIDETKNPELIYNDIYNFFTTKLGFISLQEKSRKKLKFNNIKDEIKSDINKWSYIKKKNTKDILIEKYVFNMKDKYDLSFIDYKNLLSNIFVCLIFKIISSDDIILKDGQIINIKGINFTHKKVIYNIDVCNIKHNFSPEIVLNKKNMAERWEKFLLSIQ